MPEFNIRSISLPVSLTAAATGEAGKVKQTNKTAFNMAGLSLEQQVLNVKAASASAMGGSTLEQLASLTDTSAFNEADSIDTVNFFLAAIALQGSEAEVPAEQLVNDVLAFNPVAWEKHVGVLVAAIIAVNLARQASAEMRGVFSVMAFQSAEAQGIAIVEGGKAAMFAAVTGFVVAGVMAGAGAALAFKGQAQKHTDIKSNQVAAMQARNVASDLRHELKKNGTQFDGQHTKQLMTFDERRNLVKIEFKRSGPNLREDERAILSKEITKAERTAKEYSMQSRLQEKIYSDNLTKGAALSAMAMVLSSGISSVVRLMEYAERQKEVIHQATQNVEKSQSDEQGQRENEYRSFMQKLQDLFMQINRGRSDAVSAIAQKV